MVLIQAIILGIIQGLTEFIPISSSAHLIVVPWLFGWNDPAITSLSFDVALHLGTLLAVLVYFAADWLRLLRAGLSSLAERKIGNDPDRRLAWLLVIGCLPGALVGALAESKIERLFHTPDQIVSRSAIIAMAVIIALMALVLFFADRMARHTRELKSLTLMDALFIGFAQAAAIFPGVSRSGSTIAAGLAVGLKRETAARFSFLLGAPIILGAGLKSGWDIYQQVQAGAGFGSTDLLLFVVGIAAAAVSGFLCIRFLLQFLQRRSTDLFVYYRWGLAALMVIVALLRG